MFTFFFASIRWYEIQILSELFVWWELGFFLAILIFMSRENADYFFGDFNDVIMMSKKRMLIEVMF